MQASQQLVPNSMSSFQQQAVANPTGQLQGFMPNALQGTAQPQAAQGQFSQQQYIQQPQQMQQQQQLNFQPMMNPLGTHSAQADVQLQAQYRLDTGQHSALGQQAIPGGMARTVKQ